jgi:ABC-type Fe3+-hydroxamate transport system substrate-binding protein
MKPRVFVLFLMAILVLSACGKKTISESITLSDQNGNDVTFPQEQPTVFFFMTTYT